MKVSVVNSTGRSFCWNYETHTTDNVCCISAGFGVVLFVTRTLVALSVAIKQVTVSVVIMQLEVSGAHMQVTVSAANMWVTIFIVIMQMESLLQLCRWYFLQCIMHMTVSVVIMQGSLSFIVM